MLSKELLRVLACPKCKGDLIEKNNKLVCKDCKEEYEIRDGIPILIPKELRD